MESLNKINVNSGSLKSLLSLRIFRPKIHYFWDFNIFYKPVFVNHPFAAVDKWSLFRGAESTWSLFRDCINHRFDCIRLFLSYRSLFRKMDIFMANVSQNIWQPGRVDNLSLSHSSFHFPIINGAKMVKGFLCGSKLVSARFPLPSSFCALPLLKFLNKDIIINQGITLWKCTLNVITECVLNIYLNSIFLWSRRLM